MVITQKREQALIALLQKGYVSIPQLQLEMNLAYRDARSLIEYASQRAWIAECDSGNRFPTVTDSFARKNLPKDVCQQIYHDLGWDDLQVLYFLGRRFCATLSDILEHVDDNEKDMRNALSTLLDLGLIFRHESRYYCKISRKAVNTIKKSEGTLPLASNVSDLFDW